MPKRVVRLNVAQKRLGIGHTKFREDFLNSGRLRIVRLGPKSCGVIEQELDALIDELTDNNDCEGR